ncbi:MAG: DNA polymerase I [Anaerolineales bacterium]|nr:DNA polymerase I [Anaerolineales bacterium]
MTDTSQRPLLILIDGHAVAYRAFHALGRNPGFVTSGGEPTAATYGFTRVLLNVLTNPPEYLAVSFDRGLSGREGWYADYKANRDEMPQDLAIQLQRIDELVRAFNIPVLAVDGYEADDIIGTIAHQAEGQGCDVLVITGDRDILQLVSTHTSVQLPQRGEEDKVFGPIDFGEKYPGIRPEHLPDLKGLMGDSSDNIPGVKGIGEKGALALLGQYHTIENLYDHIAEITGRYRKLLEEGRDMAFLSKQLATIMRHVPIRLDLNACVARDFDPNTVDALFAELEFRTFRRDLRKIADISDEIETTPVEAEAATIETVVVDTPAKLDELVAALNAASVIAFDVESTGVSQMRDLLVGIALAVDSKRGYYIPVGHIAPFAVEGTVEGVPPPGLTHSVTNGGMQQVSLLDAPPPPQLSIQQVMDAIRPAMTNPAIEKMGHNAKFDLVFLRRYGVDVAPISHDTMLGEWIANPSSKSLGLKDLALARLNVQMQRIDELIGTGRNKISMARVPVEEAASYATADVALLFPLRGQLQAEMSKNEAAQRLFTEMEMPLVPIIADMEMYGVLLDLPYLDELGAELGQRLAAFEQQIYASSGYGEFNINSFQQLSDLLFGKLGISPQGLKKTKSGHYSLTADVLDNLSDDHPIIPLIKGYRQLTKLKSTYVDALSALVNPYTGRVHTSFNQTGASTGRFSSSDPNLQNIPIRTEEGRRVRQAFIAPPNYHLLSVDYSQIELRILAHYSNDEALVQAFAEGRDIHASTAAAVHRIPIDQVTFEQRSFAKSVNFGLMYGMGAFRLARDSELTLAEAKDFIEAYFERFPGVKAYLEGSKDFAAEHGYVETLFGRRRDFSILQRVGREVGAVARQRAEREAVNMPIQGTAADIIKLAMVNLSHELKTGPYRSRMTLQVHDELVLEVPDDELETVSALVVATMENAVTLNVPLRAEAKVGLNWHQMTPLNGKAKVKS